MFQSFLAIVVLLNTIFLGLQTDNQLKINYSNELAYFDSFANAIFIVEVLLKWTYSFQAYWYNIWNIFDFFLVFISIFSLFYENVQSKSVVASRVLRVFRVFRAMRSLRSISILYRLKIIVLTVIKSIYDMLNIVTLMVMTTIMLSLIGYNLFGIHAYSYFENLGKFYETFELVLICLSVMDKYYTVLFSTDRE